MSNLFASAIKIPEEYVYTNDDRGDALQELSKLNIFVGPNNSGKSRLLREIVKNELVVDTSWVDLRDASERIERFKRELAKPHLAPFAHVIGVGAALGEMQAILHLREFGNAASSLKKCRIAIEARLEVPDILNSGRAVKDVAKLYHDVMVKELLVGAHWLDELLEFPIYQRVYLPLLRGLRGFGDADRDYYGERTTSDYFPPDKVDTRFSIERFSGLQAYTEIKKYLLGGLKERKLIRDFEQFLSTEFFGKEQVVLIPRLDSDVLVIRIGREKEQPIHLLGDGLQTLIILFFPLFLNRDKRVLAFIEEPEQNLHPGLQRQLLSTLLSHEAFSLHQFFLTTHSNHLLDLLYDYSKISVYQVKKEVQTFNDAPKETGDEELLPTFTIRKMNPGDAEILAVLGAQISSVFLANCTIWVEGVTDRLYWRHYLQLCLVDQGLDHRIKEDLHFVFLEYGGNNITHFFEVGKAEEVIINVNRLCGPLFLIADNDKAEIKQSRNRKLKEILKDRCLIYERLEVENLISKEVLVEVLKEYENSDDPAQFNDFDYEDYADEGLGRFIETKALMAKKRKGSYAEASGTITDKSKFCKLALSKTNKFEDLDATLQKYTHNILEFVLLQNPGIT